MAEVKCWTVAVGNLPMPWATRKAKREAMEALEIINKLEGFIGIHPCPPHGSLLLFKTENDAKRGKNILDANQIQTGFNICEIFVDEKYLPEEG